ncbi:F-box domain containing protein [Trema orientale]|uniref:F-box domain containing protein n=1 Tax=Trema orientale TaxID=63057 RepID=A0A2P5CZK5_TREOI|nr:F-box domain containing protein [Trema orientale]
MDFSDWTNLPKHLLDLVLKNLELLKDCLQFSSVCGSWYFAANDNKAKLVKLSYHHVPILLVPNESKNNDEWSMYNVLDNKFVSSKLILPPYDRPFCGSSEGWLLTVDENFILTLYKPFKARDEKTIIHLPPLFEEEYAKVYADVRQYHVVKMTTFTPDPVTNPNDLILVVICGECSCVAYIRPAKDSKWTHVRDITFDDVVFYKDQVYAITPQWSNKLVSFDITDSSKLNIIYAEDIIIYNNEEDDDDDDVEVEEVEVEVDDDDDEYDDDDERGFLLRVYLVESIGGDLLKVQRFLQYNDNKLIKSFKVFKLSLDVSRWVEIKSLGDEALFVGDSTSVSVLASNFLGCQENCIYFTNDKDSSGFGEHGPWDLGMYNLETGVCIRGFTIVGASISKMIGHLVRSPIWILPTFYT